MGRNKIRTTIFSLFAAISLSAQEKDALESLTAEMDNFARVATATKQNIDYLPFIVSVWDAEKLSKLGVATLKDALMLIPGVDISTDNIRNLSGIFRGSNAFAYGQSHLTVDGISVNNKIFDGYSTYMDMPIDIIKRIEVLRGPGALSDGENGYAGSINVITYAEVSGFPQNKVYTTVGSQSARGAGVVYATKIQDWKIHSDFYYHDDKSKIKTNGKDGLTNNPLPANKALSTEGDAHFDLNTYSLGAKASNGMFSFTGRVTKYDMGNAFGNLYALPNEDAKQKMPSWFVEAKLQKEIATSLELEIKAGCTQDSWQGYAKSFPDGIMLQKPGGGGLVTFPNGYWGDLSTTSRQVYYAASVAYSGLDRHHIKIGAKWEDEKTIDMHSVTTNRTTGIGWYDYTATAPFFDASAKRISLKLYANDTYNVSDTVALSFGVNSDKASDFDRQNDYRAAVVWQPTRDDILKFMTSTAYREPSGQEIYLLNNPARVGNHNLKPERVTAYEAQYIRKLSAEDTISTNLFYLQNKDQINKMNPQNQYRNTLNSDIYGAELELKRNFDAHNFVYLAYSLVNGETNLEDYIPSAAQHTVKASWISEIGGGFSTGLSCMYVGIKKRISVDTRSDVPAYTTADLALNYDGGGWGAQLAGRNIADARILYPSEKGSYDGDYPVNSRQLFLKLFKRF